MHIYGAGLACLVVLSVACFPVSSRPQATINRAAMNGFKTQVFQLLQELKIKAVEASAIYAASHALIGDSSFNFLDFFVDAPPSPRKWPCLGLSKRFSKCVRTLRTFMTPLTAVEEDERQHSNKTGDYRAFNAIRLLRSIWLQSTYLGLQQMANQSNIVLDLSLKVVKVKTLDQTVMKQSQAIGNWPPQNGSPTVLRNYTILQALLLAVVGDLNDACQVHPKNACAGAAQMSCRAAGLV